jgi:acyl-coenzyme A synthetase/AMP-(fatty) acid ligase/thioesterase domain-containing protein/acyl carrier protein
MKNNLLSCFFEVAKHSPDSVAVTDSKGEITFGQIFENALRFYSSITKLQFTHKRVAIFLPNGIEALSALVSTLTAGLCYSVLDPSTPIDRNELICKTVDFDYVLTNEEHLPVVRKFFKNENILIYHKLLKTKPAEFSSIPDVELSDGANMVFTSGSTGIPKVIIQPHRLFSFGPLKSRIKPGDHYDMIIPMSFGAGFFIFDALNLGAKISFFDIKNKGIVAYTAFLEEKKITKSVMTVSGFRAVSKILENGGKLNYLKELLLVGEPVQPSDIVIFREITLPGAFLAHTYGISEAGSVSSNWIGHDGEIPEKISVGRPDKEVTLLILDESLNSLPVGETGQIAISSPAVVNGYYNNPEATKKSFIIHPQNGELTYLTGDKGYISEDGFLYLLGRNDFVMKVRGNRVDIHEIEDCILKHPNVSDAVVVNKGDSFTESLLVAYCELKKSVSITELRQHVSSKLPGYMVPTFFVLKDKLPQTTTGKADRKKLTDEPLDYSALLDSSEESQAESDPLYQKLKAIWMHELKIPHLAPNHCFFNDLGGDSILAITVLERIRSELGINLPYFILFRYRTLDRLTEYIHRNDSKIVSLEAFQKRSTPGSPVFICVPPVKGGADSYNYAIEAFPKEYGLYVLTYNIVNDQNTEFYSLKELVECANEEIGKLGLNGVYVFGYSMGGLLSYEIITGLNSTKVKKLVLADVPPAKKKKINLFQFISSDLKLLVKNVSNGKWKLVKANLNHFRMSVYYLFSSGNSVMHFETKSHATMAEAAHLRFFRQFNPQPFEGDLLLIRSTGKKFKRFNFNWEKFVKGNIEVKQIRSNHHDMLNKNNMLKITKLIVESIGK